MAGLGSQIAFGVVPGVSTPAALPRKNLIHFAQVVDAARRAGITYQEAAKQYESDGYTIVMLKNGMYASG